MKAYVQITGANWAIADIERQIGHIQSTLDYRFVAIIGTTILARQQNCIIFDQSLLPGVLRTATIVDEDTPAPAAGKLGCVTDGRLFRMSPPRWRSTDPSVWVRGGSGTIQNLL